MKLSTYRGGIKPLSELSLSQFNTNKTVYEPSKTAEITQSNLGLSQPRNTTRKQSSKTDEPSSDEISVAKSIDEIFLDVEKLNLSYYDEIDMIRERLLQLETIQFYGVLEIPYVLSPSTGDEYKTTSIGGGGAPKKNKDQAPAPASAPAVNHRVMRSNTRQAAEAAQSREIEAKVQAKEDLLERITQSTSIDEITELNTEFVEISKKILTSKINSALEPDNTIDFSKLTKEDKEALITLGMISTEKYRITRNTKDINTREHKFMETILAEIGKINASKEAYNKRLNSIFFNYENSSEMNRHDRDVSELVSQIKELKAKITAPIRIQLEREPEYMGFETTFATLQTVITTAKDNIDATVQGAPSRIITDSLWAYNLQPATPFTITREDCNNIISAFRGRLLTREYGKVIFNVWQNSLRYIIDLQRSLFLKGYTTDKNPLTNIKKYHNIMSKVDHKSLILEFKNAFIEKQRGYYTKFRYKPGQNPVSDPCHIFFFYRVREKDTELPEEKFGQFHLTIHLGEMPGTAPAPAAPAAPAAAAAATASSKGKMGNLDFREGKIHLVRDQNDYVNKANLLPYIFTKTNDALPGEKECMQLIPLYQPNAHFNHTVINTGREITKILNDYLQTLHIDLGGTSGKPDKELIDKISSCLLTQPNTTMQKNLLEHITEFENTIQKITNNLVRDMMEGFYLSKPDGEQKDLQIDKLLTSLTTINNFIQQQKTYAHKISISKNNPTYYDNIIKAKNLRLNELERYAQAALAQAERDEATLARVEAARNSFTRVLRERERDRASLARGKKNRKIKYTKKRYNKVSRKRYNKVSRKRYNKVSRKRKLLKYI